jgi:ribonuclease HI
VELNARGRIVPKKGKNYYSVAIGREPGIYDRWDGQNGAEAQVKGFPKALFKGFGTLEDAGEWLRRQGVENPVVYVEGKNRRERVHPSSAGGKAAQAPSRVRIYTDGGSIDNPGPGGYGVVLIDGRRRKELSDGRRLTTNNRMELLACIEGLKAAKKRSVTIHSDSRYVVNGITKGWARRWRANGWKRNKRESAENADLWAELLDLSSGRDIEWVWVRGHAGNPENERCDELASAAARKKSLPADEAYERGETQFSPPSLFD